MCVDGVRLDARARQPTPKKKKFEFDIFERYHMFCLNSNKKEQTNQLITVS